MTRQASVPLCPSCGFGSIYTDGYSPCSVSCALKLARKVHSTYSLDLDHALSVVREEATARGLPYLPHIRDIKEDRYRYILVEESRTSTYWKLDRDIIGSELNVEYVWVSKDVGRGRLYRFAPSLLQRLPESLQEYKVRNLSFRQLLILEGFEPYWHFLPAK